MKKVIVAALLALGMLTSTAQARPTPEPSINYTEECKSFTNSNATRRMSACVWISYDLDGVHPWQGNARFTELRGDIYAVDMDYLKLWWRFESSSYYCEGDPAAGGSCDGQGNHPGDLWYWDEGLDNGSIRRTSRMGSWGYDFVHAELRVRVKFTASAPWTNYKIINTQEMRTRG